MGSFTAKLCMFLAPFALAYGLPAFVLATSGEIASADDIARRHFEGPPDALYGAAYTNPDARYKLAMTWLQRPKVIAIGSSRAEQFRSDMFEGGSGLFYNAGLLTERLYEFRRSLAHLPLAECDGLILVLDQWAFNPAWPNSVDNPLYEKEVSPEQSTALNLLQRGARSVWPHVVEGRLKPLALLEASANIGVNARLRGNGFRRDGSYLYADFLRDPTVLSDWQFKDTLRRIATGTRRFEPGDAIDPAALSELRLLLREARQHDLQVVALLPPFAPTVERALRASPRHSYMAKVYPAIAPIFAESGYALFDFTSCERWGCSDAEFFDGFHPGAKTAARLLAAMASEVPWLDAIVAQEELIARVEGASVGPELEVRKR